jgi:hypothetical protein
MESNYAPGTENDPHAPWNEIPAILKPCEDCNGEGDCNTCQGTGFRELSPEEYYLLKHKNND